MLIDNWELIQKISEGDGGGVFLVRERGVRDTEYVLKSFLNNTPIYLVYLERVNRDLENEYAALLAIKASPLYKKYSRDELVRVFVPSPVSFGLIEKSRYLVMDKVSGKPISEAFRDNSLSIFQVLQIILGFLRLMDVAQDVDWIYNDVKSDHLIWDSTSSCLSLIDWGNAVEKKQQKARVAKYEADVDNFRRLIEFYYREHKFDYSNDGLKIIGDFINEKPVDEVSARINNILKSKRLKVFLCHSSQDRSIVRELSQRLADEIWIDAWVDQKRLLPGQDWRLAIEEAVEDSDIVIFCLSNHSITKSGYVQKELRYAKEIALEKPEGMIFLIPLRLDECEVPRGLRFYQWVDYFGEKKAEGYDSLTESLKFRYEQKIKLEEEEHSHQEKMEREASEKVRLIEENGKQNPAKEKIELQIADIKRRAQDEVVVSDFDNIKLQISELLSDKYAETFTSDLVDLLVQVEVKRLGYHKKEILQAESEGKFSNCREIIDLILKDSLSLHQTVKENSNVNVIIQEIHDINQRIYKKQNLYNKIKNVFIRKDFDAVGDLLQAEMKSLIKEDANPDAELKFILSYAREQLREEVGNKKKELNFNDAIRLSKKFSVLSDDDNYYYVSLLRERDQELERRISLFDKALNQNDLVGASAFLDQAWKISEKQTNNQKLIECEEKLKTHKSRKKITSEMQGKDSYGILQENPEKDSLNVPEMDVTKGQANDGTDRLQKQLITGDLSQATITQSKRLSEQENRTKSESTNKKIHPKIEAWSIWWALASVIIVFCLLMLFVPSWLSSALPFKTPSPIGIDITSEVDATSPVTASPTYLTPEMDAPSSVTAYPTYPTLYDWIQKNPPVIKVFEVDKNFSEAEILPIQDDLYIINFSKEDLEKSNIEKEIRVKIFFEIPDRQIENNGCFLVRIGNIQEERCISDLSEAVIMDFTLSFALFDDGKSYCPGVGVLGRPYYKDVAQYNVSITWVEHPSGDSPMLLKDIELISNLAALNTHTRVADTIMTSCEAVLIMSSNSVNGEVLIYNYRSRVEDYISIEFLDIPPDYTNWLLDIP